MFQLETQAHTDVLYPEVWGPEVWGNGSFGRYSLTAFHDLRADPNKMKHHFGASMGRFNEFNRDITDHARCVELTPFVLENEFLSKFKSDLISFELRDIDHALEYVKRLREHGRWADAWSSKQEWNLRLRKEPLKVRLVRERVTKILEEVIA
jgi:hypothetical protein